MEEKELRGIVEGGADKEIKVDKKKLYTSKSL